jgi:hypothetical protein
MWILEKLNGKVWTVFMWLRIRTSGKLSYNEPLSSIKGREFLDQLIDKWLPRRALLHGVGWLIRL